MRRESPREEGAGRLRAVTMVRDEADGLRVATPPSWAASMRPYVRELLLEQAQLEKKAAAAAVQFLFRVPVAAEAHRELSALAREELVHFERTLRLLQRRGIDAATLEPSPYAEQLKAVVSRTMPERLADELLVAAVIEARSHERLHLLAGAFAAHDAELAGFYAELAQAEERHAPLYVGLAAGLVGPATADARHAAVLQHEADVLRALPWSPRLHSGWRGLAGG
mgnify:CR=1 FL=1